jgi:hypothetical protein
VKVTTTPAEPEVYRRHASAVTGSYNWVTSSGLKNVKEITIALGQTDEARRYTVRLYFAEPDKLPAGKRLFHIAIQSESMVTGLDVSREVTGPGRTLIKEFKGIVAHNLLSIQLTPSAHAEVQSTILSGLELIADDKK